MNLQQSLFFAASTLIASTMTSSAVAADAMNAQVYDAVVSCVDDVFYSGGYDEGDKQREAIMTDVLARNKQPAFSAALAAQARADVLKPENSDKMGARMEVYASCYGDEGLNDIGKKHGFEMMQEEEAE
ncbi:MAG TPA: hypothetical protein DCS87_00770 [Rheinheimera sp.]|nr:hypothetical protein [Rheinheimera sp.]